MKLLAVLACLLLAPALHAQTLGPDVVVMDLKVGKERDLRRVVIGLYDNAAPLHTANFKELVRTRYYRGMQFHRAFPGTLVQTGDPYSRRGPSIRTGTGGPGWTIPAEIRLPHKKAPWQPPASTTRSTRPGFPTAASFTLRSNPCPH